MFHFHQLEIININSLQNQLSQNFVAFIELKVLYHLLTSAGLGHQPMWAQSSAPEPVHVSDCSTDCCEHAAYLNARSIQGTNSYFHS
jgi:hypothetical protein